MTDKHTKARLHATEWPGDADVPEGCSIGIDDEFGAAGGRDYYLFTAVHGDPDELAANARRMVACWNACDGITTERLEDLGRSLMQHLFGADERAARMVKERDELLAHLQAMVDEDDGLMAAGPAKEFIAKFTKDKS